MLTLDSGPARLVVSPERGGRILSLTVDGVDLLVTEQMHDHDFGSFPMAPWAGRVRNGRFEFEGRQYQVPLNHPPHAIHGTARETSWHVDDEGVISTELSPPWPFGGRVVQRFALRDDALGLTMEVHAGEEPMPASCGWHPWWSRRLARGEALEVELRAGAMYRRDDDGIAVDERMPVPPPPWDDCFTELADPPVRLRWPGAVTLTVSTACPCVVVFTEPDHAICVEPQTHPPDAFNLGPTVVTPGRPLVATSEWRWELG